MIRHIEISSTELHQLIRQKAICFGGNRQLKIYGKLSCSSGKRLKKMNRVFFVSEEEALQSGFRPCGNCMRNDYKKWIAAKQNKF